MPASPRRFLGAALLAATALFCAAPPAAAADPEPPPASEWFDLYRQAVVHVELEDWKSVESYIRRAIAINPKSQRNVRLYGMWHNSYMPYYYLGLAEYRLGDYGAAMESFRKEEAAGIVQHDPVLYLKMSKLMTSAEGTPPPRPPAAGSKKVAKATAAPAGTSSGSSAVIEGLQAFFQNKYDASIAAFQDAMKKSSEDDLTLHLYLGMAYAGKASADKGQRSLWENLAQLEFKRVHEMDPGYKLAPGIFSEEMMALFERSGAPK